MIIVDINNVIYSTVAVNGVEFARDKSSLPLLEHMVHSQLKSYIRIAEENSKYKHSEVVIARDNGSWRKNCFEYYKANRKKMRAKDKLAWDNVFEMVDFIYGNLVESYPARCLSIKQLEADDIIASVCFNKHHLTEDEGVFIVSADGDFKQLQFLPYVEQYSPTQKKMIVTSSPLEFRFEHILRGDSGDGVPNVLSEDNILVTEGVRQKAVRKKFLDEMKDDLVGMLEKDEELARRYNRNLLLIDLLNLHQDIHDKVIERYKNTDADVDSKTFISYLKRRGMRQHAADWRSFYPN